MLAMSTDTQITTSSTYITRLNYGFAAVKVRTISVAEDITGLHYVFHYRNDQKRRTLLHFTRVKLLHCVTE
jgi:hypothetical protein